MGAGSSARGTGLAAREAEAPRFARRCVSIPLVLLAGILLPASAPLWIPLAWAIDLGRRPRTALRCGAFFTAYAAIESIGLIVGLGIWLASGAGLGGARARARRERWSFALQCVWAQSLFDVSRRIFGFRLEVEGGEGLGTPPLILFMRHASMADCLLPAVLVSRPHAIRLRYVLKQELLWDPCLDVVGHWLPNYFASRDSGDPERERRGVSALARGLGPREGLMIYPEGTRFTEAKRARVLERLAAAGHEDLGRRAAELRNVLPPRLGGPLALLDAAPGVDVVFGAHEGFEAAGSFGELWNGRLVGAVIRARFWRVSAAEIPTGREARVDWLYHHWQRIDAYVASARNPGEAHG